MMSKMKIIATAAAPALLLLASFATVLVAATTPIQQTETLNIEVINIVRRPHTSTNIAPKIANTNCAQLNPIFKLNCSISLVIPAVSSTFFQIIRDNTVTRPLREDGNTDVAAKSIKGSSVSKESSVIPLSFIRTLGIEKLLVFADL
jgi:hypothetical protein